MDITSPDQLTLRKKIKRTDTRNTQITIETGWLNNAGYEADAAIPVFTHVQTNAIVVLPMKIAESVIKAKKSQEDKITKKMASA